MKIKTVKRQIEAVEERLRMHRNTYAQKRVAYQKYADNLRYLWLLLPVSAFIVGFKRNMVIMTMLMAFLKSQAFMWLKQNVQSKIVLTLLR